jgi:hypothetical protein
MVYFPRQVFEVKKTLFLSCLGINFTNILQAALSGTDPKRAKKVQSTGQSSSQFWDLRV